MGGRLFVNDPGSLRSLLTRRFQGMAATYNRLGQPGIFRNDRFWLAGDHVVDPRVKDVPQVKALIDASERAKRVFKLTEYQGMNVRHSLSSIPSQL